MHRDKIPPQQIHAACSIVARGSGCAKRFAEFDGNYESYCSLEQLVALLCAAHEGKSASGTYHPKTEGYTRRYLYRKPDLLYCEGCTWTRISRQSIIAITWHFFQQTLLKPLTVGVVQRLGGGGGDVTNLSPFWERTPRKQPLPGTYLTNPVVKCDEFGASLPTMYGIM